MWLNPTDYVDKISNVSILFHVYYPDPMLWSKQVADVVSR